MSIDFQEVQKFNDSRNALGGNREEVLEQDRKWFEKKIHDLELRKLEETESGSNYIGKGKTVLPNELIEGIPLPTFQFVDKQGNIEYCSVEDIVREYYKR